MKHVCIAISSPQLTVCSSSTVWLFEVLYVLHPEALGLGGIHKARIDFKIHIEVLNLSLFLSFVDCPRYALLSPYNVGLVQEYACFIIDLNFKVGPKIYVTLAICS